MAAFVSNQQQRPNRDKQAEQDVAYELIPVGMSSFQGKQIRRLVEQEGSGGSNFLAGKIKRIRNSYLQQNYIREKQRLRELATTCPPYSSAIAADRVKSSKAVVQPCYRENEVSKK